MFLPDWEVLLHWVNVLEQRKANLHTQQKEELCQDILRSCSGVYSAARLPFPTYMPEDPPEGEVGEEQVGDGDADEEGEP